MVSSGKKFIVSQMCSGQAGQMNDIFNKITDKEVEFQIGLSKFVNGLVRSQQSLCSKMINSIVNLYKIDENNVICKLPKRLADIRRLYIDGDLAMTKHIPIPSCAMKNDHSFVSICECIADFLLWNNVELLTGDKYDSSDMSYNNIFTCKRSQIIFEEGAIRMSSMLPNEDNHLVKQHNHLVVLFMKMWSDDFDPNKSIKSNRQSVWIKTLTLFAMTSDGKKIERTYPISLSSKGSDHEIVESSFADEIIKLRSGRLMFFFRDVIIH
jgi:hypothetical protein